MWLITPAVYGVEPADCPKVASQQRALVGMFVERLGEFNPSTKSFAADLWVWTRSDPRSPLHPINTLRMQNARQVTQSNLRESNGWGYVEFNGQFQHEWNTRAFPFDENRLDVAVGESRCDARSLVYVADDVNSGVADLTSNDWKIQRWELTAPVITYVSNFGDPTIAKPTHWAEAHLVINVRRRHRFGLFVKATFTAYVAFLMAMMSLAMDREIFSSRISILIGSLFATAVGMRANESLLGQGSVLTTIDEIHIAVAGGILVLTAIALLWRRTARPSARAGAIGVIVYFAVAHLWIVARAMER